MEALDAGAVPPRAELPGPRVLKMWCRQGTLKEARAYERAGGG